MLRRSLPPTILPAFQSGQSIPQANPIRERTQQVSNRVGVVADESTVLWHHSQAVANIHQHAAHTQHLPRAVERFLDWAFGTNGTRIELGENVAHVAHALDELCT